MMLLILTSLTTFLLTKVTALPSPQNPVPLAASWGVYTCSALAFAPANRTRDCKWNNFALMAKGQCVITRDYSMKSFGPDPGVVCHVYSSEHCDGYEVGPIVYPGDGDLAGTARILYGENNGYLSSYACWLEEGVVPRPG